MRRRRVPLPGTAAAQKERRRAAALGISRRELRDRKWLWNLFLKCREDRRANPAFCPTPRGFPPTPKLELRWRAVKNQPQFLCAPGDPPSCRWYYGDSGLSAAPRMGLGFSPGAAQAVTAGSGAVDTFLSQKGETDRLEIEAKAIRAADQETTRRHVVSARTGRRMHRVAQQTTQRMALVVGTGLLLAVGAWIALKPPAPPRRRR